MRLADKVALVMGGGQGVGAALARRFAAEGAAVAINDARTSLSAATAYEIGLQGGRALAVQGDPGTYGQVEEMIGRAREAFGWVDIVVSGPGAGPAGALLDLSAQQWEEALRVSMSGAFNTCKAAGKLLSGQGRGGRVILLAPWSEQGTPGIVAPALSGLTRTLALELARHAITVNAVVPAAIETEATRGLRAEEREQLLRALPLGRFGRPEEVAALALMLASDEGAYITGQTLYVCGGSTLSRG